MIQNKKMNRRQFLGTTAATTGLMIVPRYVLGGVNYVAPSDKITIGFIGTGTQGLRQLMHHITHPEIQIVSVCDPNKDSTDYIEWYKNELRDKIRQFLEEPNWGEGLKGCRAGREVGKEIVEKFYAKNRPSKKYKGCTAYRDFREMLEKEKAVDAVYVMTPDHLHAPIAIAAMKKGKHVIMHKPLANVLSEVRLMADIARQSKVATHMFCAESKHTTPLLCEWIWDGAIGDVREVHNWSNRPFWPQGMTQYPTETPPIPDGFDWDLWLGPAQYRLYHPTYTHAVFRGWYDFGTGALGDMGHYSFRQIFQILKLEKPIQVEASRSQFWEIVDCLWEKQENTISFPRSSVIRFEFPERADMPPVSLYWYDGGIRPPKPGELEMDGREMPEEGILIIGDKGKILAEFTGDGPRIIPEAKMRAYKRPPESLPRPIDGFDQWVRACKGGEPSSASFEAVEKLTETVCLGNIALRIDKKLHWDSENMKFTNSAEANELITRQYREGWEL